MARKPKPEATEVGKHFTQSKKVFFLSVYQGEATEHPQTKL